MLRDRQLEQESKLANELARLQHESLKDEKMRQQVRENRCGPCRSCVVSVTAPPPPAPESEALNLGTDRAEFSWEYSISLKLPI